MYFTAIIIIIAIFVINGHASVSRGKAVSIECGYGPGDRSSIPGRGKGFFL
jgi:hypothetical protein